MFLEPLPALSLYSETPQGPPWGPRRSSWAPWGPLLYIFWPCCSTSGPLGVLLRCPSCAGKIYLRNFRGWSKFFGGEDRGRGAGPQHNFFPGPTAAVSGPESMMLLSCMKHISREMIRSDKACKQVYSFMIGSVLFSQLCG